MKIIECTRRSRRGAAAGVGTLTQDRPIGLISRAVAEVRYRGAIWETLVNPDIITAAFMDTGEESMTGEVEDMTKDT